MLMPERVRQQSSRHVHPVEASKPPCRTSDPGIQPRDGPPVNVMRGVIVAMRSSSRPRLCRTQDRSDRPQRDRVL